MELVFPRAGARVAVAPGSVVVFDPFEVHGVLAPVAPLRASDYEEFERECVSRLRTRYDARDRGSVRNRKHIGTGLVISSQTRIDATSGRSSD